MLLLQNPLLSLSSHVLNSTRYPKKRSNIALYVQQTIGIKIPIKIRSKITRKTQKKPNRREPSHFRRGTLGLKSVKHLFSFGRRGGKVPTAAALSPCLQYFRKCNMGAAADKYPPPRRLAPVFKFQEMQHRRRGGQVPTAAALSPCPRYLTRRNTGAAAAKHPPPRRSRLKILSSIKTPSFHPILPQIASFSYSLLFMT